MNGAGRVCRGTNQDRPGTRGDRAPNGFGIEQVGVFGRSLDENGYASAVADEVGIAGVARRTENDLVSLLDQQRKHQQHGGRCAARHHHAIRIYRYLKTRLDVVGDGSAQFDQTAAVAVVGFAVAQGPSASRHGGFRHCEIRLSNFEMRHGNTRVLHHKRTLHHLHCEKRFEHVGAAREWMWGGVGHGGELTELASRCQGGISRNMLKLNNNSHRVSLTTPTRNGRLVAIRPRCQGGFKTSLESGLKADCKH